jgi:hypothetical protein
MRRIGQVVGLVVLVAGCSNTASGLATVHGVVTMDGEPLDGAMVTFIPESGSGVNPAYGQTGTDGKFVLAGAKGERGLPPGKYRVTVSKMKLPAGQKADEPILAAVTEADRKYDLPEMYSDPAKTILSYSVTGDGQPIKIDLKMKKK